MSTNVRFHNTQYLLIDIMEVMEGLCQSHKHRACIILRLRLSKWEYVKTADRLMFMNVHVLNRPPSPGVKSG